MKSLKVVVATALWAVFLCASASAQYVPNHALPLGKGPGNSGFRFVGPCAAGEIIVGNGTSADPSCATSQFSTQLSTAQLSSQAIAPLACGASANQPGSIPFPVILDGATIPSISTRSLCPSFPFNGALAAPTAANTSFFTGLPSGVKGYAFLWANRCTDGTPGGLCDGNNQANPDPAYSFSGTTYQFHFTTVAKANACTLAQLYSYYGDSSAATSALSGAGISALNPASPTIVGGKITDQCYLGYVAQGANVTAAILDYEVADQRAITDAQSVLTTWAAYVKSKGHTAVFYTNAIATYSGSAPGWTCALGGLSSGICDVSHTTIANTLLGSFDLVGLIADNNVATPTDVTNFLLAQMTEYGPVSTGDYAKIFVQAQIGSYQLGLTSAVANFVQSYGLGGVDLWNNSADWTSTANLPYRMARCLVYNSPIQCGGLVTLQIAGGTGVNGTIGNSFAGWQNATNYIYQTGLYASAAGAPTYPIGGILKNFSFRVTNNAPGTGQSYTATVYVNGNPTGLICTVSDSSFACSDSSHTSIMTANSQIAVKVVGSATAAANNTANWSVELDPP